ncbi:g10100 [Coccomyxa elongata]
MRSPSITALFMLVLAICVACEVTSDVVDSRDDKLFHRSRVLAASYPTHTAYNADNNNNNPWTCSSRPVNAACPGGTTDATSCACNNGYEVMCCNDQGIACVGADRGSSGVAYARCKRDTADDRTYQVLTCCKPGL